MNSSAKNIILDLRKIGDFERAKTNSWFFKDYEYLGKKNESDKWIGVRVPDNRKVVIRYWKKFLELKKTDKENTWHKDICIVVQDLFDSEYHEARLAGAILLHNLYKQTLKEKDLNFIKKLFTLYNKNIGWNKGINN